MVIGFVTVSIGLLGYVLGKNTLIPSNISPSVNVTESNNKPTISVTTSQAQISSSVIPTEDVYAGWKTYTSNNFKLSFKYPSDFNIKESKDEINITGGKRENERTYYTINISKDSRKKEALDYFNSDYELKDSKKDKTILVGSQEYLFKNSYSVEGGPNSDTQGSWNESWETYLSEVNNNKFLIDVHQDASTSKDQNGLVIESFSASDLEIKNGELLLNSIKFL